MGRILPITLVAIFLAACRSGPPRPVEIEASDMCDSCRMAISQKRFAAEVVESDGNVRKFDDIACMLRWVEKSGRLPAVAFVADYSTRQWLSADAAYFVRTDKVDTPMGGGILAFGTAASAESAARGLPGVVSRYAALRP